MVRSGYYTTPCFVYISSSKSWSGLVWYFGLRLKFETLVSAKDKVTQCQKYATVTVSWFTLMREYHQYCQQNLIWFVADILRVRVYSTVILHSVQHGSVIFVHRWTHWTPLCSLRAINLHSSPQKGKVCHTHEKHRTQTVSLQVDKPLVRDTWPMRCQTYSHLPSCRASSSVDRYQLCCLVTEAYVCGQFAPRCYLKVELTGVEPVTVVSQIQCPNHFTNRLHSSPQHRYIFRETSTRMVRRMASKVGMKKQLNTKIV